MLKLYRMAGESIRIGDNILVMVFEIEHSRRVRIGVDAPGLKVDRGEKRKAEDAERESWRRNYAERVAKRR